MQSLNIDAARRHGVEVVAAGPPTGSTPISLNTPDILNTLISITNPFFESTPVVAAHIQDSQNASTAVDEDKKVFATLETPVVPKCPVQSVSATRTHLIKESLKVAIQSKRKSSGKEDIDFKTEMEVKIRKKDEVDNSIDSDSQAPHKLTPEDEERRKRRRERNKIAATKCRNKKKEKTYLLVQESECLEDNNISLKSEISKLEVERQRLVQVLTSHAPTCKQNTSAYGDFNHNTSYYDQAVQL